jgi:lipopolysaccharide export system protein LptA
MSSRRFRLPLSPRVLPRLAWAATGLALALTSSDAAGQEGCEFGDQGNDVVDRQTLPNVGVVTYISRPHFVCADGVQIWADSAVAYSAQGMSHLMGAVRYVDAARELRADEARYFSDLGRIQAQGNMSIRDEGEGSFIENGDLVYLRRTDFRDEETLTVTTGADGVRPRAVLPPPPSDGGDTNGSPGEPYTVVGDRIVLRGASYFTSVGDVEIVRDSVFAFADSAEYDPAVGSLLLEGSARVESSSYDLRGRTITMAMGTSEEETSEIRALRDARLTGDNLILTSAQIDVFLRDGALERLVATPIARGEAMAMDSADLVRPEASVQDFVLTADSLEVAAPGGAVERVFAAGSARSVATSRDSLNVEALPEIARSDWLEGDTVIVTFKPAAATYEVPALPPDSATSAEARPERAGELEVERVVARVRARSLYRLPPSDTTARPGTDPPAVHYVVGDEITIEMEGGEVADIRIVGATRGVLLEPLARRAESADSPAAPPADTSAMTDTTVVTDTTSARDPTLITLEPISGSMHGRTPDAPKTPEQPAAPDAPRKEEPWTRP